MRKSNLKNSAKQKKKTTKTTSYPFQDLQKVVILTHNALAPKYRDSIKLGEKHIIPALVILQCSIGTFT